MADKRKQQNFLQGTAMLAMATALVKIIGAVYKIPLNAIIGEKGFGYFNTAYEIYNVLLMVSTAGLPVAMSRMISQANSLESYNQVRRVYTTARGMFLGLGIGGSLLMTVLPPAGPVPEPARCLGRHWLPGPLRAADRGPCGASGPVAGPFQPF